MKVDRTADRLVVKDNPLVFWIFYCAFVVGGCLLVGMMWSLSVTGMQLGFGLLIGVGNVLGGLLMLRREPASIVVIDRPSNEIRVRRWGLMAGSARNFSAQAVDRAIVETAEHTDGGTVFRPSLLLKDEHPPVPISRFWYQTGDASRHVSDEINAFLSGAAGVEQGAVRGSGR